MNDVVTTPYGDCAIWLCDCGARWPLPGGFVCPKRPSPSIAYQGEPQQAESTSEFLALCNASHREALRTRDDARAVEVSL